MTEAATETDSQEGEGGAEETAASEPKVLPPLVLKKGTRIRSGHRSGRVLDIRGRAGIPYDLLVAWDSEKYPVWLVYTSVERDYQQRRLALVAR